MSETGRKLDVEDVLSSIRRLVSEEARGDIEPNVKPVTSDEPERIVEPEKLVLTPSLRVPEADRPVPTSQIEQCIEDIEGLVRAESRNTETALPDAPSDPAAMISAINVSMRDFGTDQGANTDEPPTVSEAPMADFTDPVAVADAQANYQDFSVDDRAEGLSTDSELADPQEPFVHAPDLTSGLTILENTAHLDEPPVATEADTSVALDDGLLDTDPAALWHTQAATPAQTPQASEPAQKDDVEASAEAISQDEWIEAAHEPVSPMLQTPRIEREDPFAGSAVHDLGDEEDAAPAAGEPEVDLTAADEGAFIDEDMLREIVSEMVRSELQGELGDRITRNVRKLVRREIHRALASRDFE